MHCELESKCFKPSIRFSKKAPHFTFQIHNYKKLLFNKVTRPIVTVTLVNFNAAT